MRECVVGSDRCGALGGSGGVGDFSPGCELAIADFMLRAPRGSWAEWVTFCSDRPVLLAPAAYLGGYAAPPSRCRCAHDLGSVSPTLRPSGWKAPAVAVAHHLL